MRFKSISFNKKQTFLKEPLQWRNYKHALLIKVRNRAQFIKPTPYRHPIQCQCVRSKPSRCSSLAMKVLHVIWLYIKLRYDRGENSSFQAHVLCNIESVLYSKQTCLMSSGLYKYSDLDYYMKLHKRTCVCVDSIPICWTTFIVIICFREKKDNITGNYQNITGNDLV